jgi:DNA-binding MarR family transcriptional regulator
MSSSTANVNRGPLLGALLRLASQAMTERFNRWIESSEFAGIQPAHSAAIQPLWEAPDGARITSLARASRITKQSMSALIADLEAAGYVERVDDPDDARASRVRLTAHGRAYGRAVRAFARSIEAEWAEQIGAQRVEELRATLQLLRTKVFLADE